MDMRVIEETAAASGDQNSAGARILKPSETEPVFHPELTEIYNRFATEFVQERAFDCSSAPLNVRQVVDEIMRAVNWLRRDGNLPPDVPIRLAMGENHACPTHLAMQALLTSVLKMTFPDTPIAMGIELPHNFRYTLNSLLGSPLSAASLAQDDRDGRLALTLMRNFDFSSAPITRKSLYQFLLKEEIPIQLNDIAINEYEAIIDQKDPRTSDFMKKYAPDLLGQKIIRSSGTRDDSTGLALSNLFMAESGNQQIRDNNAELYIQTMGNAHLFGWRNVGPYDGAYEGSYIAATANAPVFTLPVLITDDGFKPSNLPAAAGSALPHSLVFNGLSGQTFLFTDKEKEIAFYNQMAAASGMPEFDRKLLDEAWCRQDLKNSFELPWHQRVKYRLGLVKQAFQCCL